MTKELLQQALDALVKIPTLTHGVLVRLSDVEPVFLAATAAPEHEPIICKANQQCLNGLPCVCVTPAPQRTWVGLTDDEIDLALGVYDSFGGRLDARKIEAKLKEKNT